MVDMDSLCYCLFVVNVYDVVYVKVARANCKIAENNIWK